jgi:hypothetical protein
MFHHCTSVQYPHSRFDKARVTGPRLCWIFDRDAQWAKRQTISRPPDIQRQSPHQHPLQHCKGVFYCFRWRWHPPSETRSLLQRCRRPLVHDRPRATANTRANRSRSTHTSHITKDKCMRHPFALPSSSITFATPI